MRIQDFIESIKNKTFIEPLVWYAESKSGEPFVFVFPAIRPKTVLLIIAGKAHTLEIQKLQYHGRLSVSGTVSVKCGAAEFFLPTEIKPIGGKGISA